MKNSTNVKKLWTLSVLIYADLGCRSGTNWQLASREESLALAITMHAAPSRTEVVNLLFGQLPRGELHFYLVLGAFRGPGHNRPIINLLSSRNVAGEQVGLIFAESNRVNPIALKEIGPSRLGAKNGPTLSLKCR